MTLWCRNPVLILLWGRFTVFAAVEICETWKSTLLIEIKQQPSVGFFFFATLLAADFYHCKTELERLTWNIVLPLPSDCIFAFSKSISDYIEALVKRTSPIRNVNTCLLPVGGKCSAVVMWFCFGSHIDVLLFARFRVQLFFFFHTLSPLELRYSYL